MANADEIRRTLEDSLRGSVQDLHRLSGGASRHTWAFDLVTAEGVRPLICQMERPGNQLGPRITDEAVLLRLAVAAGVPVAKVVATSDDSAAGAPRDASDDAAESTGAWIVTERLDGEAIPRKLLRDPNLRAARAGMAEQCGRALAAIHGMPLDAVPELDDTDPLGLFRSLLAGFDDPRPALELAARRLETTRPVASSHRCVVHGDFRTGNLLVSPSGLQAVLDWELAHIGDPAEDLGWFCVRAWRFGSAQRAGGFGGLGELLTAYADASGRTVDPEVVSWWEAVGTLRWAVMCMVQAATHRSGVTRSVELVTIGRRVCESEWDLLGLLGADRPASGPGMGEGGEEGRPFGYPAAADLLEGVREFLTDDVRAATEGRTRFHSRVAATAVQIVERELSLGQALAAAHQERLGRLGFADDVELVKAIRSGECDQRWDELAAALAESARDQLLIANPDHLLPDG